MLVQRGREPLDMAGLAQVSYTQYAVYSEPLYKDTPEIRNLF